MPKIVEDERARQGGKGRPVLIVLIGSFLLLGLYLVSLLFWSGTESPPAGAEAGRQAPASSVTSGAPPANPAYPAPAVPRADAPATGSAPAR